MADDLAEYRRKAQEATAGIYNQDYERAYRQRAMQRFGEELPAAMSVVRGMETGETSSALAAQRLGMGQNIAEQATLAASGAAKAPGGIANPLAARQAMFAGGQAASEIAQRGAMARSAEIDKAYGAALEAQMRQIGYGQQLEQEELRRRLMAQQAQQRMIQGYMGEDQAEQARNMAIAQGVLGAGAALGSTAIRAMPPSPQPMGPYGNLK